MVFATLDPGSRLHQQKSKVEDGKRENTATRCPVLDYADTLEGEGNFTKEVWPIIRLNPFLLR